MRATATGYRKLNCWEFMQCGREPGGRQASELGVCPAAVESRLDGIFGGMNGGRCCWAVAGTFCRGQVQGTFAQRYRTCEECEFFRKMQAEESPVLSHTTSLLLYLSAAEAQEWNRYYRILRNLVDPSLISEALRDVNALKEGAEKHITAFFSDVTGFSAISAKLESRDLAAFLNEYLSAMTKILKVEGGTLDKYIGDGIVGIFGAPVSLENDALSAARASLRMQQELLKRRNEWQQRGDWCSEAWSLRMRIGLSSGLAKVGFMGPPDVASYTMTGSTVNLAKWLEGTCKYYGLSILVSEPTRDLIANEMVLRRIDRVQPKGRTGTEALYELLGARGSTPPGLIRAAEIYEAALELYDRRRWGAAAKLFREAAELRGDHDRATKRFLRRCEKPHAASPAGRRSSMIRGERQDPPAFSSA